MAKKYSEEVQKLLKTIVDECDLEDRSVRERQIRTARRLKLFWEGFTQVWYSEVAHDWRVWDLDNNENVDQGAYDKPVNVFRAYLESIIAALSVTVPSVKCYPDDADNVLDLETARAGDRIGKLISRHNDVSLLWLHALFIYCTEGMVAAYNYSRSDKEYGTYKEQKYEDAEETHQITTCPNCGNVIDDQTLGMGEELEDLEKNEFQPGEDDVELHSAMDKGLDICPACMMMMDPEIKQEKVIVTRLVGETTEPKSRVCLESYGLLYVKVPVYAKKQCECTYLIFSDEINYTLALEEYTHLRGSENLRKQIESRSTSGYDLYDQWGRLSPQYRGEYPLNVVTRKRAWIRPCQYNCLRNDEDVAKLKKEFPDGVKVTFINNEYAEACPEAMDDYWTLTYNPLSDYIHFDPLGLLLTSIQEITNDLISLTIQTIEHGITQTFADPGVLNFNAYEQTEVVPGGVFPAQPKSGKALQDGFYEMKTATLSAETLPFAQSIQGMGQLVSGALPSLFGGQLEGSDTASEYSMSRAQALQRLQNTWKMFTSWWKLVYGKAIPMYIKNVKDDERDVQRKPDGGFINVFIRRAELEGKIGKIELEANENLPLTWSQRKDIIMGIVQAQNPESPLFQMLMAPENLPILREAIGIDEFYVPGEDDREKQYDEIKLLLNSQPIPTGDPMVPETPSVEIDPDFDNHQVHYEIVKSWATSEAGRQAKVDNEAGYKNVLLHGKAHLAIIQQQQMQQQMQQAQNTAPPNKEKGAVPKEKPKQPGLKNAPIRGEQNVSTVQ